VKGIASNTICNGELKYANGELRVEAGTGTYLKRPAFPPVFAALKKIAERNKPVPVKR
jgi:dihydropyrimidinase